MFRKMEDQSERFQSLHDNLVDFMTAVTGDAKVTAMLNRQRGDRYWRMHQGDKLRDLLLQWIATEVCKQKLQLHD